MILLTVVLFGLVVGSFLNVVIARVPTGGSLLGPRSACPACGADHNSGWREDADIYDGVGLPEQDFNYDDFVEQEFGSESKPPGLGTIWWIVGIALIVAFVVYLSAAR